MTASGTKATGQFTLALDPDERPGKAQYDCYQILFTDTNGHSVRRPVRYHIDVDPDLPPVDRDRRAAVRKKCRWRRMANCGSAYTPSIPTSALRHVTLQAEREAQAGRSGETGPAGAPGPHQAGQGAGGTFDDETISSGRPI